jgi:outer membrane protein TolC
MLLWCVTAIATDQVTLPELLRLGINRNPAIDAARNEWAATIEQLPQVTALPDPMIRFDYFLENVETRIGPQECRYGLSQAFPYPGTLAQAGAVVEQAVRIKHTQYDRAIRDFIVDLKLSYHEITYLRGAMVITAQNQDLLNHILKIMNARYAEGKAKLNDVLKAQSQLAQLSYDVILLRELEQVETAKINVLLDLPTATPLGEAALPPLEVVSLPIDEIEAAALAGRQEIEIAAGNVGKTKEEIRLAALQNRPKFTVSTMRIATGDAAMPNVGDSGNDAWLVGVGLSLPLWREKNRSRVRQAELIHEAALSSHRVVENQTRAGVRSVYFRLENARRLIELYEKSLIPQAEQAMKMAEQWHGSDVKDSSAFLETQGVWLNFNLARLRAATDYQQYKARLERIVGGRIPAAKTEDER